MSPQSLKYLFALPSLVKIAVSVMFEGISAQDAWAGLPWDAINFATLILIVSFLVQDLASSQSWIRRWWFDIKSPFTLESVILNDEFDPDRIVVRALVKFKRIPVSRSANFRVARTTGESAGVDYCFFSVGIGDIHLNASEKLDIGVIMVPTPGWTPRKSVWGAGVGPEQQDKKTPNMIFGAPVRITMEVEGYEISFALLPTGKSAHNNPATLAVFTENEAEHVMGMK